MKYGIVLVVVIVALFGIYFWYRSDIKSSQQVITTNNSTSTMDLTSSAFENDEKIPSQYTCDGEGVNPPLSFSDVPMEAESLVLIVDDPDAPGGTWTHWLLFNLDPRTTGIAEGSVPEQARQGVNDFGNQEYGGPCPPTGSHRYFFKLYALDIKLGLPDGSDRDSIEKAMEGHVIEQVELVGNYSRT